MPYTAAHVLNYLQPPTDGIGGPYAAPAAMTSTTDGIAGPGRWRDRVARVKAARAGS